MAAADCQAKIEQVIREGGPLTVAAFMNLALYDPSFGYYARAAQRTGRAGDFFTSVDVGPLFGELIAAQIAEMDRVLHPSRSIPNSLFGIPNSEFPIPIPNSEFLIPNSRVGLDVVEAGAGNGRLAADILRALETHHPDVYRHTHVHLVELSAAARREQRQTLERFSGRLASSSSSVPPFEGVLVANELLDAMPVHQVVMRDEGLREVYVDVDRTGHGPGLRIVEAPPSTSALPDYLARVGVTLEPGWRVEINLGAVEWVGDAVKRLRRGFLILFDYGHLAPELYSVTHSAGTLTTYAGHRSAGPETAGPLPPWLQHPGEQDLTAHVDFTSVRAAAEREGCATLGFMDQTYFVLGLLERLGTLERLGLKERLALKTLIMPGGLGSTMKVLILGKGVGQPTLACCSAGGRIT